MASQELELKVLEAQHRIEDLYHETKGKCYLAFSGGKDSMVLLSLIKQCEEAYTIIPNSIPAVFSNTGIELDATEKFVKWVSENYYGNVQIIRPDVSFSYVLEKEGKPIKSKFKSDLIQGYQKKYNDQTVGYKGLMMTNEKSYTAKLKIGEKDLHIMSPLFDIKVSSKCCNYLKKKPFVKYQKEHDVLGYILGERMAEGGVRETSTHMRMKNGGKICTKTKGKYTVKLPIIDWSDDLITEYIEEYKVPLSEAYEVYGLKRTGCIGCPFARDLKTNLKVLHDYEPNKYKATMFWLKDVYIAQNTKLEFDEDYESDRVKKWDAVYSDLRYEMLVENRPDKSEKYYNRDKINRELVSFEEYINRFYLQLALNANNRSLHDYLYTDDQVGFVRLVKDFCIGLRILKNKQSGDGLNLFSVDLVGAINLSYDAICVKWFNVYKHTRAEWAYEISKEMGENQFD